MIKLVVSDIDGTLISKDNPNISKKNIEAIHAVRERGIPVVLASGRIHTTALPYARILDLDTPVISCNGAMIRNSSTGEIIYTKYMDVDKAMQAIDILRRNKHEIHFYDDNVIYVEEKGYVYDFALNFINNAVCDDDDNISLRLVKDLKHIMSSSSNILKMGYYAQGVEVEDLSEAEIEKIEGLAIVRSNHVLKDVMRYDVNKGEAVKFLANSMGIDISEVMTIGDNNNDYQMISMAGLGVAMGNAFDGLKHIADDIAPSSDQDGLAWALTKYLL